MKHSYTRPIRHTRPLISFLNSLLALSLLSIALGYPSSSLASFRDEALLAREAQAQRSAESPRQATPPAPTPPKSSLELEVERLEQGTEALSDGIDELLAATQQLEAELHRACEIQLKKTEQRIRRLGTQKLTPELVHLIEYRTRLRMCIEERSVSDRYSTSKSEEAGWAPTAELGSAHSQGSSAR